MPAKLREERQHCWEARGAYYACLDAAGVVTPGKEGPKQCTIENKAFVKNCAKSWVSWLLQNCRVELMRITM